MKPLLESPRIPRFVRTLFFCSVFASLVARSEPNLSLENLFPGDRLVEVQISLSSSDWDALRNQSRSFMEALSPERRTSPPPTPYEYVPAKVTIDGVTFQKVGLRKKGFLGSQDTTRPSLKIKLDFFEAGQEIDGLKTLTLNNNKQDVTLMNQYLGYRMFDQAQSPGSRCGFAKVTVNGTNLGVYAHVESVKRPLLKREFGDDSGSLYEGTVVDFFKGWEQSFELKTGDAEAGQPLIDRLTDILSGSSSKPLVEGPMKGKAWVPTHGSLDDQWFLPKFDDSHWQEGEGALGYESERGFESMIHPNWVFKSSLHGRASSAYLRYRFDIQDLSQWTRGRLLLRMRCDDGFIAYLNGKEVARLHAPETVKWNAVATESRPDASNAAYTDFDITAHRDELLTGENLLAIHGLNISKESSDMLIEASLAWSDFDLEKALWQVVDKQAFYRFWTLEGLLSFWDGYSGNRNNFFFYCHPQTQKLHFMPWGTDCMFQKYSMLGIDPNSPRSVRTVGLIAHRLYQIPSVRQTYARHMEALMNQIWDETSLLEETYRIEKMVRPHLHAQQRRTADFEAIRTFIRERREDVEKEIMAESMPLWNAMPEPPPVIGGRRPDAKEDPEELPAHAVFFEAAKTGNIPSMKKLLKQGQDVNYQDEGGGSALGLASLAGQRESVVFLIQEGADPNLEGNDGSTPMHGAAFMGHLEVVQELIAAGGSPFHQNNRQETPIDSCSAPWSDELKGIAEFILAITNIQLELDALSEQRKATAQFLRKQNRNPREP